MTKHVPTTKPRLEKRRQQQHLKDLSNPLDVQEYLAVLERFQSIRAHWWWWGVGLSICGWHGVPLMLRVWWLFSHVFTWFFFGGRVKLPLSEQVHDMFFSESDWRRSSSKPTLMRMFVLQGCACTHVSRCFCIKTFNVEDDQYLHISSCILSLYIFSCQLLA